MDDLSIPAISAAVQFAVKDQFKNLRDSRYAKSYGIDKRVGTRPTVEVWCQD